MDRERALPFSPWGREPGLKAAAGDIPHTRDRTPAMWGSDWDAGRFSAR